MAAALLPVEVIHEPRRAASVMHPIRQALLRELGRADDSAAGLARKLGQPRQRLNYHLKALKAEALVEEVDQRRRGNCTEVILRATARSYLVSPAALGEVAADPRDVQDRFSWAYLAAVAARTLRDLSTLRRRAAEAGKRLATLTIETDVSFRSPDERAAFARELTEAVAEVVARYNAPDAEGARKFRLVIGAHPALPAEVEETSP